MSERIDRLGCRLPNMTSADGSVRIEDFVVDEFSLENVRNEFLHGRGTPAGTYKRLVIDGKTWMSDTLAERQDHHNAVVMADNAVGGTGLINGLGLGCVVAAWADVLRHVDVVEFDPRVIELVQPWFTENFGDKVTIHFADAYDVKWPTGKSWDVIWHDIWISISAENIKQMGKLRHKYDVRCSWQGFWAIEECKTMAKEERRLMKEFERVYGMKFDAFMELPEDERERRRMKTFS